MCKIQNSVLRNFCLDPDPYKTNVDPLFKNTAYLVIFTAVHLDDFFHCLVDLQLGVEPRRAGGQNAPVSRELTPVHLQDDVTEATLLALKPKLLKDHHTVGVGLGDSPGRRLEEFM